MAEPKVEDFAETGSFSKNKESYATVRETFGTSN
jgi:hypothetical protein